MGDLHGALAKGGRLVVLDFKRDKEVITKLSRRHSNSNITFLAQAHKSHEGNWVLDHVRADQETFVSYFPFLEHALHTLTAIFFASIYNFQLA